MIKDFRAKSENRNHDRKEKSPSLPNCSRHQGITATHRTCCDSDRIRERAVNSECARALQPFSRNIEEFAFLLRVAYHPEPLTDKQYQKYIDLVMVASGEVVS